MGVGNVPDKGNTEVVLVGVGMWQVSWVQFWTGKVWIAFESEKQRCMILLVFMGFHDLMKRFRSNKKLIHSLLPDKQYIEMLSVVRHCARCRLGFQNDLHYPHCLALLPSQPHPPPHPSAYSACGPAQLPYWLIICTSFPFISPPYSCLDSISFLKCHMPYTGLLLSSHLQQVWSCLLSS